MFETVPANSIQSCLPFQASRYLSTKDFMEIASQSILTISKPFIQFLYSKNNAMLEPGFYAVW